MPCRVAPPLVWIHLRLLLFFVVVVVVVFSPFIPTPHALPTGDNLPSSSLSNQSNSDSSFYLFLDLNKNLNVHGRDRLIVSLHSSCFFSFTFLFGRVLCWRKNFLVLFWHLNARTFICITNVFSRSYHSSSIINGKSVHRSSVILVIQIEWDWQWIGIFHFHTGIESFIGKKENSSVELIDRFCSI